MTGEDLDVLKTHWTFSALSKAWAADTSSCPEQWSASNPARGQCVVTALVIQDFLGGELIRGIVDGSNESHYWNEIRNGDLDMTIQQFERTVIIRFDRVRPRAELLANRDTLRRYELFRSRVLRAINDVDAFRPR
jgi:hypothetical protein